MANLMKHGQYHLSRVYSNKQVERVRLSDSDVCKAEKLLGGSLVPKPGASLAWR